MRNQIQYVVSLNQESLSVRIPRCNLWFSAGSMSKSGRYDWT